MFAVMAEAKGQGLAAPQIGILKRLVVIRFDRREDRARFPEGYENRILFNPEITLQKGRTIASWEGCLSVPGMRGYVERSGRIRLKYFDEKGASHDDMIDGYDAVVYQHECDHLDGVLYVDRLKDPSLFGYEKELDEAEDRRSRRAV